MINLHSEEYYLHYMNGTHEIKGRRLYSRKKYWSRPKKVLAVDTMPLVEAARTEVSLLPTKTPVSVLQELLSRRGSTPKYELVQIEGAIHEPTFRYRVTVADTVALGTGRSKKEAKHAAAKNVLEKLVGNPVQEEGNIAAGFEATNQPMSSYDKISGNPIGTLQEMCISRRWAPPTYEMTSEEGLPHERQFKITCTVFKFREVGSGKSKKLAKREAAYKMWERLQECPLEPLPLNYGTEAPEKFHIGQSNISAVAAVAGDAVGKKIPAIVSDVAVGKKIPAIVSDIAFGKKIPAAVAEVEASNGMSSSNNRYADLKNTKISTLSTPHGHKVSTFHRNLKQHSGPKLKALQAVHFNDATFNYIEFLQEIALEQQFEVTYVDIEEKSLMGKCQCLVQLSTLPVAVCYGSALTSKGAQSEAAHNALEYLKIMTKK